MQTALAGGVLAIAVAMGTVATAAPAMASAPSASVAAVAAAQSSVAASTVQTTKAVPSLGVRPTRDLTECWAQVGRVIGGYYGGLLTTITAPWAAIPIWAAYLGTLSQEKRDKMGNLAC